MLVRELPKQCEGSGRAEKERGKGRCIDAVTIGEGIPTTHESLRLARYLLLRFGNAG